MLLFLESSKKKVESEDENRKILDEQDLVEKMENAEINKCIMF